MMMQEREKEAEMTSYLTCAETAKLVRQALKESFPGVKFSVRSDTYAGGASIDVGWTDGPTSKQVDQILGAFEGAYFDGMIDYKGSRYHRLDGNPVRFGADFVSGSKHYSDALIARAIEDVAMAYGGCEPFTVDDYKRGGAWTWKQSGGCDMSRALNLWFAGEREIDQVTPDAGMEPLPSATLARVAFAGDDGYGQGTVGRNPPESDGEQAYRAQEEARERNAELRKLGLA